MWQVIRATMVRNQISNWRAYPWAFTVGNVVSGIYIVLVSFFAYHYLIQGQLDTRFAKYTGTNNYLTFAIIGGLLNSMAISMIMNVSRALITEWREGTLEALLLAPSRRTSYLIGTTVQQLYRIGLEFIPVVLIGLLLGLKIPNVNWASTILAIAIYLFACFSMALVLGAIMMATRDTYIVQNTLFTAMTLLCGFQFPTQYLPLPLQWLGQFLPLTLALRLLRGSLLTGTTIWGHLVAVIVVLLLGLFYSVVGIAMIKRTEFTLFERRVA